jgi:hypothetical protein
MPCAIACHAACRAAGAACPPPPHSPGGGFETGSAAYIQASGGAWPSNWQVNKISRGEKTGCPCWLPCPCRNGDPPEVPPSYYWVRSMLYSTSAEVANAQTPLPAAPTGSSLRGARPGSSYTAIVWVGTSNEPASPCARCQGLIISTLRPASETRRTGDTTPYPLDTTPYPLLPRLLPHLGLPRLLPRRSVMGPQLALTTSAPARRRELKLAACGGQAGKSRRTPSIDTSTIIMCNASRALVVGFQVQIVESDKSV